MNQRRETRARLSFPWKQVSNLWISATTRASTGLPRIDHARPRQPLHKHHASNTEIPSSSSRGPHVFGIKHLNGLLSSDFAVSTPESERCLTKTIDLEVYFLVR